jgi:hypothetical protein
MGNGEWGMGNGEWGIETSKTPAMSRLSIRLFYFSLGKTAGDGVVQGQAKLKKNPKIQPKNRYGIRTGNRNSRTDQTI